MADNAPAPTVAQKAATAGAVDADKEAQMRAAAALSTPQNMTGTHGLTETQLIHVRAAATKFKTGWFTIGNFCDATNLPADGCLAMFKELHELGAVRKPENDGGCEFYQVVPEMALRTIMSGRMPNI